MKFTDAVFMKFATVDRGCKRLARYVPVLRKFLRLKMHRVVTDAAAEEIAASELMRNWRSKLAPNFKQIKADETHGSARID